MQVEEFLSKDFNFIAVGNDLHHCLTQNFAYKESLVQAAAKSGLKCAWTSISPNHGDRVHYADCAVPCRLCSARRGVPRRPWREREKKRDEGREEEAETAGQEQTKLRRMIDIPVLFLCPDLSLSRRWTGRLCAMPYGMGQSDWNHNPAANDGVGRHNRLLSFAELQSHCISLACHGPHT